MDKRDMELNFQLMSEMGLEEGDRRRVYDQDTGAICKLGQKEIVTPGAQGGKNAVEFDLIGNPRLMTKLFGDFVDKLTESEELESDVVSFSTQIDQQSKKNQARVMFEDGTSMESRPFDNETLCYADLIFRIGGEDRDLSSFDFDRRKAAVVKPPKRTPRRKSQ